MLQVSRVLRPDQHLCMKKGQELLTWSDPEQEPFQVGLVGLVVFADNIWLCSTTEVTGQQVQCRHQVWDGCARAVLSLEKYSLRETILSFSQQEDYLSINYVRNPTKIELFKVYLIKITVLVKAIIKMINNKLVNWLACSAAHYHPNFAVSNNKCF